MNSFAFMYRRNLIQSVILTNSLFIIIYLVMFAIQYHKLGFIGVTPLLLFDLFLAHLLLIYLEIKFSIWGIFRFIGGLLTVCLTLVTIILLVLIIPMQNNVIQNLTDYELVEETVVMKSIFGNNGFLIAVGITLLIMYIGKTV